MTCWQESQKQVKQEDNRARTIKNNILKFHQFHFIQFHFMFRILNIAHVILEKMQRQHFQILDNIHKISNSKSPRQKRVFRHQKKSKVLSIEFWIGGDTVATSWHQVGSHERVPGSPIAAAIVWPSSHCKFP